MSTVKNSILALFDDNIMGAITAADMRIFVDAIFDSKENEIRVFDELQNITDYQQSSPEFPIEKFDVIVITSPNNQNQITDRGVYIALKSNPNENDVLKIANVNYDEFLKIGKPNQLISLDALGNLTWIEPLEGYYIEGSDTITNILDKYPSQKGPVYIASNTELTAPVPGKIGDGYSWTGEKWVNVGQLRGPQGDIQEIAFANQYETDAGYIETKAVSPKTLKNSVHLDRKEDTLGNPLEDNDMLVSTKSGTRKWEKPIRNLDDLHDVTSNPSNESILMYDNTNKWYSVDFSSVIPTRFVDLKDTPVDYIGKANQGLVVNSTQSGIDFRSLVTSLNHLSDVNTIAPAPQPGDVLKYNGTAKEWRPAADNTKSGVSSARPQNVSTGTQYFDTTLGKPIWFNGLTWVDALGASV